MNMTYASKRFFKLISVAILLAGAAAAQPTIESVRDLASKVPPGFPFYSLAPGGFIEIHGSGLGPDQRVNDYPSFPLGQILAGSSVEVTVGDTTVNALIASTRNGEINAILPTETPLGSGQLRVTYNGETSDPVDIFVANSMGIFTQNGRGNGPALAINADFEPITIINPAHTGEIIMVLLNLNGVAAANSAGSAPASSPSMNLDALQKKMKAGDPKAFGRAAGDITFGVTVNLGEDMQTPPLLYGSLFPGMSYVIFQVPDVVGCWVPFYIQGNSAQGVYNSSYAQLAIATPELDTVCHDPYGPGDQKFLQVRGDFLTSGGFQASRDMKPYLTKFELSIAHLTKGELYNGYPSLLFPNLFFSAAAADISLKKYVHLGGSSLGSQVIYSTPPGKHQQTFLDFGPSFSIRGNETTTLTRQDDGTYLHSQNYLSNLQPLLQASYKYKDQNYMSDIDLGVPGVGESPKISKVDGWPLRAMGGMSFSIMGDLTPGFQYHVEFASCSQDGYCANIVKFTKSPFISFSPWELGHLPSTDDARLIIFYESIASGTIADFPTENTLIPSIHTSGVTYFDGIPFDNPQNWQINAF